MKTRKLRIKRKVVVKSKKKGKLNRKISYRRKQRKSMMRRQKRNSRNNLKKRFSKKIGGGDSTKPEWLLPEFSHGIDDNYERDASTRKFNLLKRLDVDRLEVKPVHKSTGLFSRVFSRP